MSTSVQYVGLVDYPGYEVGYNGSVWSYRWRNNKLQALPHPLKPRVDKDGYYKVAINQRDYYVHTLVLLAFHGYPQPGQVCRHLDDDNTNNVASNLCWGTPLENAADAIRNGITVRGSKHPFAKLSEADIPIIRGRLAIGESAVSIARDLGVNYRTICRIKRGEAWLHV